MDTLFIIIGIASIIAFAIARLNQPAHPQIVYVPVEVAETQGSGLGCLPLIIGAVLLLLALGTVR